MNGRKIVDYLIVISCGKDQYRNGIEERLEEKVRRCLEEGWQPLGSPYVVNFNKGECISCQELQQAMVKYHDKEEEEA